MTIPPIRLRALSARSARSRSSRATSSGASKRRPPRRSNATRPSRSQRRSVSTLTPSAGAAAPIRIALSSGSVPTRGSYAVTMYGEMPDPALIVVDVQQAFDDPSWGERRNPACEEQHHRADRALAGANDWPLVFVRHDSTEARLGTAPGSPRQRVQAVITGEPDVLVTKETNSCFYGEPDLQAWLEGEASTSACRRYHHQPLLRDHRPRRRQPRLRRPLRARRHPHLRPPRPLRRRRQRRRGASRASPRPTSTASSPR